MANNGIIQETPKDKEYLLKRYTPGQLKIAESELRNMMSAEDIAEFDQLSDLEKKYFLSGFLDNIEYYKLAKFGSGGGNDNNGGTPPPPDPHKHLPIWQGKNTKKAGKNDPNARKGIPIDKQQKEMEQQSKNLDKQMKNVEQATKDLQKAIDDLKNSTNGNAQQNMEKLKEALERIKDATSDLADNTKDAADNGYNMVEQLNELVNDIKNAENDGQSDNQSGKQSDNQSGNQSGNQNSTQSSEQSSSQSGTQSGSQNSNQSGSTSDNQSNGQTGSQTGSQTSAGGSMGNKATTIFNKAKNDMENAMGNANNTCKNANDAVREANKSENSCDRSRGGQSHAELEQAMRNAQEAAKNATKTQESAQKTKEFIDELNKEAQKINDMHKKVDSNGKNKKDGENQFYEPIISEPAIKPKTKLVGHHKYKYKPTDMVKPHPTVISQEDGRRIAEKEGHTYDGEDMQGADVIAKKTYNKIKKALKDTKGWHGQGGGNTLFDVEGELERLYAHPTIDWRTRIEKFFSQRMPVDITYKRLNKMIALKNQGMFAGNGAYQRHTETPMDKITGLAQVLYLVDTSGSMCRVAGDGENIFVHIMTELIEMASRNYIKNSAAGCYNGGAVTRAEIKTWTSDDAPDVKDIKKYFPIPVSNGGTDIITALEHVIKMEDVYNGSDDPLTLIVAVTDGEDNWDNLSQILTKEQMENTIVVLTQQTDDMVKTVCDRVYKGGVPAENIIGINYIDEWGEAMNQPAYTKIKRSKK